MNHSDDDSGAPFDVRVEQSPSNSWVISVRGEIDMVTAPELEAAFTSCGQSSDVLIDLTKVTFLDSSGLKVLVFNAKKLSSAGHNIQVEGLSDHQRSVVRITGLSEVLNLTDLP